MMTSYNDFNTFTDFVYKIPYRRARAWPSARASKGILASCIQLQT